MDQKESHGNDGTSAPRIKTEPDVPLATTVKTEPVSVKEEPSPMTSLADASRVTKLLQEYGRRPHQPPKRGRVVRFSAASRRLRCPRQGCTFMAARQVICTDILFLFKFTIHNQHLSRRQNTTQNLPIIHRTPSRITSPSSTRAPRSRLPASTAAARSNIGAGAASSTTSTRCMPRSRGTGTTTTSRRPRGRPRRGR